MRAAFVFAFLTLLAVASAQPCIECSVSSFRASPAWLFRCAVDASGVQAARSRSSCLCVFGCRVCSACKTSRYPYPAVHLILPLFVLPLLVYVMLQACGNSNNCLANCKRDCPKVVAKSADIDKCRQAGREAGQRVAKASCDLTLVSSRSPSWSLYSCRLMLLKRLLRILGRNVKSKVVRAYWHTWLTMCAAVRWPRRIGMAWTFCKALNYQQHSTTNRLCPGLIKAEQH